MLKKNDRYKKMSILLAGDDDAYMFSLYATLKILGIEDVLRCSSLGGIKRIVTHKAPALLLYDFYSWEDDLAWVYQLKRSDPAADPLIISVHSDGNGDVIKHVRAGIIFDIVKKPVDEEILLTKIIRAHTHRELIGAFRENRLPLDYSPKSSVISS